MSSSHHITYHVTYVPNTNSEHQTLWPGPESLRPSVARLQELQEAAWRAVDEGFPDIPPGLPGTRYLGPLSRSDAHTLFATMPNLCTVHTYGDVFYFMAPEPVESRSAGSEAAYRMWARIPHAREGDGEDDNEVEGARDYEGITAVRWVWRQVAKGIWIAATAWVCYKKVMGEGH